jgi:hypothetical protein
MAFDQGIAGKFAKRAKHARIADKL